MLWRGTIVSGMVVDGFGSGDLPTGYDKCAPFDLHC